MKVLEKGIIGSKKRIIYLGLMVTMHNLLYHLRCYAHSHYLHTAFIKEDTQSLRETTPKEEAAETANEDSACSLNQYRGQTYATVV